jgi:plastocyanin
VTGRRLAAAVATAVVGLAGLSACSSGGSGSAAGSSSSSSPSMSSSMSSPSMSSSSMSSSKSPMASGSPMASDSAMASSMNVTITIKSFEYSHTGKVMPGSKVTVTNEDGIAHTVTADSGNAFDVTVGAGKSATFTAPSKPGTYPFHCTYHSNMHGTLEVG